LHLAILYVFYFQWYVESSLTIASTPDNNLYISTLPFFA